MEAYLIGDDFGKEQSDRLGIQPDNEEGLWEIFDEGRLRPKTNGLLRKKLRDDFLKGFMYLMESFSPYKTYISALRKLEKEYQEKSDDARHAFYELRFGTNKADLSRQPNINLVKKEIISIVTTKKKILPDLLDRDVGRRAVMCAFGCLYEWYRFCNEGSTWLDYAKWFTAQINKVYEAGWFEGVETTDRDDLLRHICFDQFDGIVNYRLEASFKSLGALMVLLVLHHGADKFKDKFQQLCDMYFEDLHGTLTRGYKKQHRPDLKREYPDGGKPLNDAVAEMASDSVREHMAALEDYLSQLCG